MSLLNILNDNRRLKVRQKGEHIPNYRVLKTFWNIEPFNKVVGSFGRVISLETQGRRHSFDVVFLRLLQNKVTFTG